MRIWLAVAAIGLALLALWAAVGTGNYYVHPFALMLGMAGVGVGVGGALWELASNYDRR